MDRSQATLCRKVLPSYTNLLNQALKEFAERVQVRLREADGATRREILRALVKCIEVDDEEVRIVYRIARVPFVEAPKGAFYKKDRRQVRPHSGQPLGDKRPASRTGRARIASVSPRQSKA
jgi:hypothetical protein